MLKIGKLKPITVNVVIAKEQNFDEGDALEWILLTSEPISSFACTRKITRYYELRWRIEDFHKAWKTGVGAEEQRMQSIENLEKMIVILSFVAIRLLQLKEYFEYPTKLDIDDHILCEELLAETEWKVLWNSVEKRALPEKIPTAAWAYQAIGKLGGWTNSKKTGKAAWLTIWKGWFRLKERLEGLRIATEMMKM